MGKNVRRGRTSNVRCTSCGQLTRRDRAVYLFRNGIKAYYCPDCAKKVHGAKLFKGAPKFIKRREPIRVKRKFTRFATDEGSSLPEMPPTEQEETTGEEPISEEPQNEDNDQNQS